MRRLLLLDRSATVDANHLINADLDCIGVRVNRAVTNAGALLWIALVMCDIVGVGLLVTLLVAARTLNTDKTLSWLKLDVENVLTALSEFVALVFSIFSQIGQILLNVL